MTGRDPKPKSSVGTNLVLFFVGLFLVGVAMRGCQSGRTGASSADYAPSRFE